MNEIWLGPLLNNNRALLIERCAKLVANNQSDAFIYLAASFPLLENVTQSILDGNRNRGVWGELPVYLFRGLVRRVLYSAIDEEGHGLPPRIPIDRDELPLKRSLISQVLQQLLATNQLKAFAPLATREGCVNSISTLLGEIERAARTPTELIEILAARARDIDKGEARGITQLDFDREVALIYSTYYDLLNQNQFTEEDADQLRALWVLRGLIDDKRVNLPWLPNVELFIIDGFFDFTPVQGEILRELIPRLPHTIVNLNHDDTNPEIFTPFQETIGQLQSIATFDTVYTRLHRDDRHARDAARQSFQSVDCVRRGFRRACARDSLSRMRRSRYRDSHHSARSQTSRVNGELRSRRHRTRRPPARYLRFNDHARDARRVAAVQSGVAHRRGRRARKPRRAQTARAARRTLRRTS
jgi:hypothetical protein